MVEFCDLGLGIGDSWWNFEVGMERMGWLFEGDDYRYQWSCGYTVIM